MCGIYGIIGKDSKKYKFHFELMGKEIKHRGPDFSGNFISNNFLLGHQRLSILDLSKNANQPLKSLNSRYLISFNGEIYNYIELLNQLNMEKNFGDTRALIEILSKHNIKGLDKLRGMFAFALHDSLKDTTYLVRDRFGIKPLYYMKQNNLFYFASEIKPLLKISNEINVNEKIIKDYLKESLVDHTNETFFKNIYQLDPGSYLKVDKNGNILQKIRWYNLSNKLKKNSAHIKNVEEQYYEIFKDTIKLHLRSEVKVGLALSGGIDSKIILDEVINRYNDEKLNSYSFCFNEKKYSEKTGIIQNIGKHKLNSIMLNQNESILKELKKNIIIQEQPYGGIATIAMNNLFRKVKDDKIKVMLTGAGADDCLAGSNREIIYYLSSIRKHKDKFNSEISYFCEINNLDRNIIIDKINNLKKNHLTSADGTNAADNYFLLDKSIDKKKYNSTHSFQDKILDRIKANKLPRTLRYEDRNSMYNSIENRVPFLDHILVEYSLNLPENFIIKNGLGKIILRNILKKKYKYKNAFKKKQSIQTPQTQWLVSEMGVKIINKVLNKKNSFISNYIDIDKAKNFIKSDKLNKIQNSNFIWQWLSLEIWYEQFIK
jgi:asparagine synthase (glutamine-hydrolysing)